MEHRPCGTALITPALFSQPPPHPPGEEGEVCRRELEASSFPFSPRREGGRLGEKGVGGYEGRRRSRRSIQGRSQRPPPLTSERSASIRPGVRRMARSRSTRR